MRKLESSIEDSEVVRYFYLDDGIMLQEKLISQHQAVLAAVSGNDTLEWMLFENLDGDWEHITTVSTLAKSSLLTDPLTEFAIHTGYLTVSESFKHDNSYLDVKFNDQLFVYSDTITKPIHKSQTTYQIIKLYTTNEPDKNILASVLKDESFKLSEERHLMLSRAMARLDHKYDISTFDMSVYQEGCNELVQDLANLIAKKYKIKTITDNGLTNHFKDKSVLYFQDLFLDLVNQKSTIDKFVKMSAQELIIVSLLS